MALIVGIDRGFITREQGTERMLKIVRFLIRPTLSRRVAALPRQPHRQSDSYFSPYDDGGDLVETSFLMQGLLAAASISITTTPAGEIRDTINFWKTIEWDWYRQSDPNFLYWHWSPDHGFYIHHPLIGWNETMIIYLLAIASPSHGVPANMFHTGFASQADLAVQYRQGWGRTTQGDHYTNGNTYHGRKLNVGVGSGGELFFTHYSFLGFDPRGKRDRYTNYFHNNRTIALIARLQVGSPGSKTRRRAWGRSANVSAEGGRSFRRRQAAFIHRRARLVPLHAWGIHEGAEAFHRDLGANCRASTDFAMASTRRRFGLRMNMGLNQAPSWS
jgi:hypothetical protein